MGSQLSTMMDNIFDPAPKKWCSQSDIDALAEAILIKARDDSNPLINIKLFAYELMPNVKLDSLIFVFSKIAYRIQTLELEGSGVELQVVLAKASIEYPALEGLNLFRCDLSEKNTVYSWGFFISNPLSYLRELQLNHNSDLEPESMWELTEFLRGHPTLEKFDLSYCGIGGVDAIHPWVSLLSEPAGCIRELVLEGNAIELPAMKLLAEGLKENTTLEQLDLSHCSLQGQHLPLLTPSLSSEMNSLRVLNLSWNNLETADASLFSMFLIANSRREKLNLEKCHLNAVHMACFVPVLSSTECLIHSLILSANDLGSTGAEQLAKALKGNQHLLSLGLAHCNFQGGDLAVFWPVLLEETSMMKSLDLRGNFHIVNSMTRPALLADMKSLAMVLKTRGVSWDLLDLSDCYLSEKYLEPLIELFLEDKRLLGKLHLKQNQLSKKTMTKLWHGLEGNETLRHLETDRLLSTPIKAQLVGNLSLWQNRNRSLRAMCDASMRGALRPNFFLEQRLKDRSQYEELETYSFTPGTGHRR